MGSLNYHVCGDDLPYLQLTLAPGQEAMAEQGAMMYVNQHIVIKAVLGDGSESSFWCNGAIF